MSAVPLRAEVASNVCRFNFANGYNRLPNDRDRAFMNASIIGRVHMHIGRSSGLIHRSLVAFRELHNFPRIALYMLNIFQDKSSNTHS